MVNGSRLTTGIDSKSTRMKIMRVLNLFKNAAVSESDGVAVEINGSVVGKARYGAVAGELPCAALADGYDSVVLNGSASCEVRRNTDPAGKAAAVCERHIKGGDAVDYDIAVYILSVRCELDLCAVRTG